MYTVYTQKYPRIARNVLLYTLITDDEYSKHALHLWSIFYHFFIDEAAYDLLVSQCSKLVELSTELETWNTSQYSSFLRISSRFTLSALNRLWTLYAATSTFSADQRRQFKDTFLEGMKHTGRGHEFVFSASRGAGPVAHLAWTLCSEAHKYFWETGVTHEQQGEVAFAAIVNPTFAYTFQDEGFVPHYGTCPMNAFHLAPLFIVSDLHVPGSPSPTTFDMFRFIKSQFYAWCDAARACFGTPGRVILRFIIGDVLAVCYTLQAFANTGHLSSGQRLNPWNASSLVLDGNDYSGTHSGTSVPRRFNVIDTSNLSDHIGMLNILLTTAPLLERSPSAVLLTETMLSKGVKPSTAFTDRLFCDPHTMFMLLDLVPYSYFSGFVSQSNIHEIMTQVVSKRVDKIHNPQYHERMVWKFLSLIADPAPVPPSPILDAKQLSELSTLR